VGEDVDSTRVGVLRYEGLDGLGTLVNIFGRLARTVLDHRVPTLIILTVIVLGTLAGALRIGVDFSARAFFGADDPETEYLYDYLDRWGEDDLLMIVFDGGEESVLDRESLEEVEAIVDLVAEDSGVRRVTSVASVPRARRGPFGAWLPVPLMATVPSDPAALDTWRAEILGDEAVVPNYLSEDGHQGVLLVSLAANTDDLAEVRPVVKRLGELVKANGGEMEWYLAGIPAIRGSVLESIILDQLKAVPIAGALMALLLAFMFRNRYGVLIPMIAAGVPFLMLLGIIGWTGEPIGLLNQTLSVLVPVIAVADAIHLLARYHEEVEDRAPGQEEVSWDIRRAAVIETMQHMGLATFLTSFTTVVGFLSLWVTGMPVLRSFGVYAAIGISLAYLTVLFIVPLALSYTKPNANRPRTGVSARAFGPILTLAADWSVRVPGRVLLLAGLVLGVATYGATQVSVDSKMTQSFADDHPVSIANHLVDSELGGVLALEYELVGQPGDLSRPEVLAVMLDAERDAVASYEDVRASASVASTLASTVTHMGGKAEIPERSSVIDRLYTLQSENPDFNVLVNDDRSRGRLLVRTEDVGAKRFEVLGREILADLQPALEAQGVSVHLTGTSLVAYRGMVGVSSDLRESLSLAFVFIAGIIAILFRSLSLGIMSVIPNLVPLLMGYGFLGLVGWNLDASPAVVFTVALGIAVDDTIHVLARFREARNNGFTGIQATVESVFHSGKAVMITSVILAVGFLAISLGSQPANKIFGRLGAFIVLAAMICNLFVLPSLLVLWSRIVKREKDEPA